MCKHGWILRRSKFLLIYCIISRIFICEETEIRLDGMHMIERKQDALSGAMLRALMAEHLREEREKKQHEPIQDASFNALATRIVDDARSGTTHKSVASSFLSEIGLETPKPMTERSPLRHVGQRARKVPLNPRKIRKVKRTSCTPQTTQRRTAVGHERRKKTVQIPR